MKKLKIIAVFMISLILSLPFIFADQFSVERFSGVDNIDGFARDGDVLTVEVLAEMKGNPTEEIAKQRVKIFSLGSTNVFDSCTKQAGTDLYKCKYSTGDILNVGRETYTMKLYDADNNEKASLTRDLITDFLEPSVKSYSINPDVTKDPSVSIAYIVEDYASELGNVGFCTGIKEISIADEGKEITRIGGNLGQCAVSGTFTYNIPTNVKFRSSNICLRAYDFFDQSSAPECAELKIDRKSPEITGFEFRDADGFSFEHVKPGQAITGDVYVEITDEGGIDSSKVFADFSALNPGLRRMPADGSSGEFYIWEDITTTNPETCSVVFEAADILGNTALTTLNCQFEIDDLGPTAKEIRTEAKDEDGTYLLGINGTITATFTEQGSGLDKADVFLDLGGIGLGANVKADECTNTQGDDWECKWYVTPAHGTVTSSVRLSSKSADDLGNPVTNSVQADIRSDTDPPKDLKVLEVNIYHTQGADYGDLTVRGDNVEFKIAVTGASEAFANFSEIGAGYVQGICDDNETLTKCTFSDVVTVNGPLQTNIGFEFFDRARNKASIGYDLTVYGIANETKFNYWKSSVECSPELIDRSVTSLIEHPVYCHIKLNPINPIENLEPAFTTVADLSECSGPISGYISDIKTINNGAGSKNPYLAISLAPTEFNIDELSFSCPVYITTKIGDFVTPTAEQEEVNVSLKFYNMPLGKLYDEMDKDIEDALNRAEKNWGWVEKAQEWVRTAERICTIKSLISTVLGVLDVVLLGISAAVAAAKAIPGGQGASEALEQTRQTLCGQGKGPIEQFVYGMGTDQAGFSFFNVMDQFCSFVNCQQLKETGGTSELINDVTAKNPVCSSVKDFLNLGIDVNVEDVTRKYEGTQDTSSINVKDSLIMSAACLCIPGIIYNLNKLAQIECRYAICLAKDVKDAGIPSSWCRDEKHYLTCNFVLGEIFSLLPLAHLYNQVVNILKSIFTNPISAVAAITGCLCGGCKSLGIGYDFCKSKDQGFAYAACSIPLVAAKVGDAIASWNLIKDSDYWKTGTGYCDEAKEIGQDIERARKQRQKGGSS